MNYPLLRNSEKSKIFLTQIKKQKSIYVDVDGTLLIWPEPNPGVRQPGVEPEIHWDLVRVLRKWKQEFPEKELIIWSANGKKHAQKVTHLCGLQHYVDAFLTKPSMCIDDSWAWFQNRTFIDQNFDEQDLKITLNMEEPKRADKK